ncbi:MAG: adenylate/guanylate cyclase domain-containing protein [Myxococcales bacterium]|nr:adenylate/guanylate cyclase domain-containing protein [Myxococcales bacterium]
MLGLFALRPAVLDRLELSLLDARFRLRGAVEPQAKVVVLAIDESSIDRLGRWPWPRRVIADLLDRLAAADVAAVGLDLVFSEPEDPPGARTLRDARARLEQQPRPDPEALAVLDRALLRFDNDRQLAASIRAADVVVLGLFFRTESAAAAGGVPEPEFGVGSSSQFSVARIPPEGTAPILTCSGIEPNLEIFESAARRSGFINALRDRDGVTRRAPLVALCGGTAHLSLPLALAELVLGKRAMVLGDRNGIREIRLGKSVLATDEGGRILVNFRGPVGSFPYYSVADVLEGRIGESELAGSVVLVGPTEPAIGDLVATPFGTVFPGVEVHANVVDNLLSGEVLRRHDGLLWIELAELLFGGLLLIVMVPRLRRISLGVLFASALLALQLGVTAWLFVHDGLWLNAAYPALTLFAVYVAVSVTHGVAVEARGRVIRRQFGAYVPGEVVDAMVEDPEAFQLGTERRDLSILFSDIRDFTSLAEELGPDDVSRLLNAYLTPMTRIVFDTQGTLDKYIGDAIVAFWGAPGRVEDHPRQACVAALAMRDQLELFRRTRKDLPGADRLRVGIGIHSGEVAVGTMGSELRFQYTASGDAMNLCSRLEGLTRRYGVEILATGQLVERLPEEFLTRELDAVRVKGRHESFSIFEVLSRAGDAHANSESRTWLDAYAQGLAHYRMGEWSAAEAALREVSASRGGLDAPSEFLLGRIASLREAPPPEWDGVWVFEEK